MQKKIAWVLCLIIILALMPMTITAETLVIDGPVEISDIYYYEPQVEDSLWVDSYGGSIWYGGRYITPQPASFIQDGNPMVPFRAVVEALLDGTVDWNDATRWVTAQAYNQEVSFPIDDTAMLITVINDRIFIPVEVITNFFLQTEH